MLGNLQPGEGPPWHQHTYDEIFMFEEGEARFTIGEEQFAATVGQIVIARAGVPHAFVNTGTTVLRMIAIHMAANVVIEWLEPRNQLPHSHHAWPIHSTPTLQGCVSGGTNHVGHNGE